MPARGHGRLRAQDRWHRRTYPALLPFLHLDYIYFEHTLRVKDAFFHHSRLAMVASDHVPLVADFYL